jgi:hypothetical protein
MEQEEEGKKSQAGRRGTSVHGVASSKDLYQYVQMLLIYQCVWRINHMALEPFAFIL